MPNCNNKGFNQYCGRGDIKAVTYEGIRILGVRFLVGQSKMTAGRMEEMKKITKMSQY